MKKIRILFIVLLLTLQNIAVYAESPFFVDNFYAKITVTQKKEYKYLTKTDFNFYKARKDASFLISGKGEKNSFKTGNISVKDCLFTIMKDEKGDTVTFSPRDGMLSGKTRITAGYTLTCKKDSDKTADYALLNLVEPQGTVPVANAYVKINLPTEKIEGIEIKSDKGSDNINYSVEKNVITVTACDLLPGDTLYAVIKLPEGTFKNAKSHIVSKGTEYTFVNIILMLIAIIFIVVLFFRFGLDGKIIYTTEFYPPENLSPIETEYAAKRTVSDKTFGAMVLCWAVDGFVKITHRGGSDYTLTKLKDMNSESPGYIKSAFEELFKAGDGNSVTGKQLENKYYLTVEKMKAGVVSSFIKERILENSQSEKFSKTAEIVLIISGVLIIILTSVLNLLKFSAAAIAIILFVLSGAVLYRFINFSSKKIYKNSQFVIVSSLSVLASFGISVMLTGFINNSGIINMFSVLIPLWILLSSQTLAALIGRKTDYAASLMGKIRGFKRFMKTPPPEKISELIENDPMYLYKILPFAVTLDCEDKWIQNFPQKKSEIFKNYVYEKKPFLTERDKAKVIAELARTIGEKSFSYYRVKKE